MDDLFYVVTLVGHTNGIAASEIMRLLQRKRVFCSFLFILSLLLTQRVLTLQETRKYFLVDEYVAATQRNKRHLLLFFASRLVHDQRGFRHRNPNYGFYFNHLHRLSFVSILILTKKNAP